MSATLPLPTLDEKFRTCGLCNGYNIVYNTHVNSREIIRRLEAAGWHHYQTTGSHWHYRHDSLRGKVTVPHPRKDIPIKTLKSIEKQAGVKLI